MNFGKHIFKKLKNMEDILTFRQQRIVLKNNCKNQRKITYKKIKKRKKGTATLCLKTITKSKGKYVPRTYF